MVYHLKHADTIRDMIATNEEWTDALVLSAATDCNIQSSQKVKFGDMFNAVKHCKDASSKEGLEMCLFMAKEDIAPEFGGVGHNKKFEEFLQNLDKEADEYKQTYYAEHVI